MALGEVLEALLSRSDPSTAATVRASAVLDASGSSERLPDLHAAPGFQHGTSRFSPRYLKS